MDDRNLILSFGELEIAVLGDLMMDEYVWGNASRVSPESPVLVIDVQSESAVPGGAANVAANVMALGAKARVFGAVGDDPKGKELCSSLEARGADVVGIVVDPTRPTTRKTRVVAQNQQVLRVDRESSEPMDTSLAAKLGSNLRDSLPQVSAVLISDYAKGVVNESTVGPAIQLSRHLGKYFVANGKPDNVQFLSGGSVVSLNLSEAVAASGDKRFKSEDIDVAGEELRAKLNVDYLVVTRGAKGLCIWSQGSRQLTVPAHPVEVYDVAGAGDTVIATLTLALAAGAEMDRAARLAVLAAALVVGKVGVATVSASELIASL